ncbi:MAG: hypothetical protein ABSH53_05260 [Holophaga sp.]|jgi:hypothetical protein
MSEPARTVHSWEMSLDRAAFLRLLPAAMDQAEFHREETPDGGAVLVHREAGRGWRIRLAPLPPLRLGAVTLDRLRVDLDLEGYAPEEADGLVDRFLLHFQRGGG